ncbi:MAG: hypothetical protein ACJAW3_001385 [Lentimonas sp.]|jgi:hypothetical protein
MNLFNIYIKKTKDDTIEDLVLVKNKFSFSAFLFNFFWFLLHKMWKEAGAFIVVAFFFGWIFYKSSFGFVDVVAVEIGLFSMIGLNAGYWYEQKLLKTNYKFVGNVFGKNTNDAKIRFIDNHFKSKTPNKIFSPSITDLVKS